MKSYKRTFRSLKVHGKIKHDVYSKGEYVIEQFLEKKQVKFFQEVEIKGMVNKAGNSLRLDFFLPHYDIAIEYDGAQHFNKKYWNSEEEFNNQVTNDLIKSKWCKDNHLNLLRITYKDLRDIRNIIENFLINKKGSKYIYKPIYKKQPPEIVKEEASRPVLGKQAVKDKLAAHKAYKDAVADGSAEINLTAGRKQRILNRKKKENKEKKRLSNREIFNAKFVKK